MLIYGDVATEEQIIGKNKKHRAGAAERARKKEEAKKKEEEKKKEEAAAKALAAATSHPPVIPSYPAPPSHFANPYFAHPGMKAANPMMMMHPMGAPMGYPGAMNPNQ
jgi:hypothetical protein